MDSGKSLLLGFHRRIPHWYLKLCFLLFCSLALLTLIPHTVQWLTVHHFTEGVALNSITATPNQKTLILEAAKELQSACSGYSSRCYEWQVPRIERTIERWCHPGRTRTLHVGSWQWKKKSQPNDHYGVSRSKTGAAQYGRIAAFSSENCKPLGVSQTCKLAVLRRSLSTTTRDERQVEDGTSKSGMTAYCNLHSDASRCPQIGFPLTTAQHYVKYNKLAANAQPDPTANSAASTRTTTSLSSSIRKLRDITGAGMQECLKALQQSNFIVSVALQKLISQMDTAPLTLPDYESINAGEFKQLKHGWVGLKCDRKGNSTKGILLELKCETSFVADTILFKSLLKVALASAMNTESNRFDSMSIPEFLNSAYANVSDIDSLGYSQSENILLDEAVRIASSKLGETIRFERKAMMEIYNTDPNNSPLYSLMGSYLHNAVDDEIGQIGVLVGLRCEGHLTERENQDVANRYLEEVAMHIAAAKPIVTNVVDLKQEVIDSQKAIILNSINMKNRSESIINRIVEGKMKKFYEANVLVEQEWYLDDSKRKVSDIMKDLSDKVNSDCRLTSFRKFKINDQR